jgi:hypothetical protein
MRKTELSFRARITSHSLTMIQDYFISCNPKWRDFSFLAPRGQHKEIKNESKHLSIHNNMDRTNFCIKPRHPRCAPRFDDDRRGSSPIGAQ